MANIHYHFFTSNWDSWMSHFWFVKILTSDNSMKAQDCMVLSAMSGSFHFWCSNQPYQMSGPSREQLDPRWNFRTASNPTNSRSLNNSFPLAGKPKWSCVPEFEAVKKSGSCDASSETWQAKDSTLNGACYAALGASSLLGASTSYGPVVLISLLPEGWMALHTRMKAVHWGWSPLSWWCSSPRSWCGGRPRKNLVFLNSVYVLSFATCPDWQYSCFFLVRKFTVKSMSAQF